MTEIDETSAAAYALEQGLLPRGSDVRTALMTGGVSNVVLWLEDVRTGAAVVLKQARERLRVQADWRSRLDRVWREVLTLRVLADIVPGGMVPQVLSEDHDNYAFAMTAVPWGHIVWKQELLSGKARVDIFRRLGRFLGAVHSRTRVTSGLPGELFDKQVFEELRLDPYYRWTADRLPEVRRALHDLIASTEAQSDCLVLADFSPKNILLLGDEITVLDFETAHVGDPAFDLGFFLTHLVLKKLHVPAARDAMESGIREFWSTYRGQFSTAEFVNMVERRTMSHLAACLLARVDGKSPVDYLTPSEQDRVRTFAVRMLNSPAANWWAFEDQIRLKLLADGGLTRQRL